MGGHWADHGSDVQDEYGRYPTATDKRSPNVLLGMFVDLSVNFMEMGAQKAIHI